MEEQWLHLITCDGQARRSDQPKYPFYSFLQHPFCPMSLRVSLMLLCAESNFMKKRTYSHVSRKCSCFKPLSNSKIVYCYAQRTTGAQYDLSQLFEMWAMILFKVIVDRVLYIQQSAIHPHTQPILISSISTDCENNRNFTRPTSIQTPRCPPKGPVLNLC